MEAEIAQLEPAERGEFLASLGVNLAIAIVLFLVLGGRKLGQEMAETVETAEAVEREEPVEEAPRLDAPKIATLVGLVVLVVGTLVFDLDVGLTALTLAAVLSLIWPASSRQAVGEITWPTVLLICGVLTYVAVLQAMGTIDFVGNAVTGVGVPVLAALLLCYIGAIVSAFASSVGLMGALIPLAVPFLAQGQIGAVGVIIALCIASSVVDSSPFSTSGALVVANSPDDKRDFVYKRLLQWGMSMIIIAPISAWAIFVLPGWL